MKTRKTEAKKISDAQLKTEMKTGGDYMNPAFLFSTTRTDLLLAAERGLIDIVKLARKELANRGLDADGNWIGFDEARRVHGAQQNGGLI